MSFRMRAVLLGLRFPHLAEPLLPRRVLPLAMQIA
jgi:hypothetical protein